MMTKEYAKKLASMGFAIIPCKENKAPVEMGWQSNPIKTPAELDIFNCPLYGMRGGDANIECIDVDLKVIVSLPERLEWWNEYYGFLKDNIENFDDKVVIARTIKGGYHIIYKSDVVSGNTKIAKLEGMKEAIIETRGKNGQFILYDKFIGERQYHDISFITTEEREIIWSISKTYNWIDPQLADIPTKKEYRIESEDEVTPWDDFNSKFSALDIVGDEFTIVRNTAKQYVIKRHGATSPHSGYVFKSNGCMFLFSTGTNYPSEKLLSPFALYTHKNHLGDFKKSTIELYEQGYGSRRIPKIKIEPIKVIEPKEVIDRMHFPLEVFPDELVHFVQESNRTLGMSVDYMGSTLLWLTSLIIGNSIAIQIKNGWVEPATIWLALVGKPGIGKTPSIKQIIAPLQKLNIREQKEFQKQYQKYVEFEKLDKKEKERAEEVDKPKSKQFIVGDITLEALVDLHEENPNAVGVFKDELAAWFKDMNKYRPGSDLEFWLSSWSADPISLNRKTSRSSFVDKPFIPVLGGVQPSVFDEIARGTNKENGFIDRILISYPELKVNKYNKNEIDPNLIIWYEAWVVNLKQTISKNFFKLNDFGDIDRTLARFDKPADAEWNRIFDKIVDLENSDFENEYMKSMYPKQKAYIPRFALILNIIWSSFNSEYKVTLIHKESVLRAEKLSQYFVNMAKLVKSDSKEKHELKKVSESSNTAFSKFKAMYSADNNINKTVASELLEVSRKTIYEWIKKLDNK
jgi:hypothetical protein